MLNSILVLVGIAIAVVAITIVDLRLEAADYYYKCYKRMQYSYNMTNFECIGNGYNICAKCPYHKRHLKSINKLKNKERI